MPVSNLSWSMLRKLVHVREINEFDKVVMTKF
jgi:hypothetical protein